VNLRCGRFGDNGYGYRHILEKHGTQWQAISTIAGQDWRSFTDWVIAESLRYPLTYCATGQPRNNVNYVGWIQIKDTKGRVLATYYPRVATGMTSYNIITAFPQGTPNAGC